MKLLKVIKNKKGASIIETALIIPVFLLIVLGTVDVAQIFISYNDLIFSLREGLNKATISTIAEGKKVTTDTFNNNKFFKNTTLTDIKVTQAKNNLGQPFCFTGEIEIPLLNKDIFGDSQISLQKTSCIIQEVNNLK